VSPTTKKSDKVLVIYIRACAPYAKGEIVALPRDMAESAMREQGTRPAVAELYKDGIPKPRDRRSDSIGSVESYKARAEKAEAALSVAVDKLEDAKGKK